MTLVLRNARVRRSGAAVCQDVAVASGGVTALGAPGSLSRAGRETDLAGRLLLPGLVNAHDHLDFSTFPALGTPPYASVYDWSADVDAGSGDPRVRLALAVPLADRLFLGGLRNLLAGVTAVVHHNPYHRSLGRDAFPVRVLSRYAFAHSPGLTPRLRRTYRTTDRRIPWLVHAAEGTDARCRGELQLLADANVLRQNTVLVHGVGLAPEDGPRIAQAGACLVWCPESNRRLYGATAAVAALRGAGVRVGLGSDSPVSGVRDALSNLAAARREGWLSDDELVELATRESAAVARLPAGGADPGAVADLLAVDSLEALLEGDRRAVSLALVGGRPLYGAPALLEPLEPRAGRIGVDGAERALAAPIARRAAAILRSHPALSDVSWIRGLAFD
jgi:cytosine/adenosine deaminase-related metal-dependent hydrolase